MKDLPKNPAYSIKQRERLLKIIERREREWAIKDNKLELTNKERPLHDGPLLAQQ